MADIPEELKTFGDRSKFFLLIYIYIYDKLMHIGFSNVVLPSLLAEEKERATTQYVNITAIATLFSSVTATTLQFSFMQGDSALGGAVNLFWFLSLVFSVSSAVSSMLGMTWRKSSM